MSKSCRRLRSMSRRAMMDPPDGGTNHDPVPAHHRLPAGRRRARRWRNGSPTRSRPTSTTTAPSTGSSWQAANWLSPRSSRRPDLAKVVTSDGVGTLVTDGPFAGVQGVGRGLPDRRRRIRGPRHRDRRADLGRAGRRRRRDPAADPGAPDHGRRAVGRRRDAAYVEHRREARLNRPLPRGPLRDLAPRVLATLARRSGDFDAADDAPRRP